MSSKGCMASLSINLSRNAIGASTIPASWYSRILAIMDLSYNSISGTLPEQWGLPTEALGQQFDSSFPSLELLAVQGNNLTGKGWAV